MKKKILAKQTVNFVSKHNTVEKVYQDTSKQIEDGLSKETASTGTPISELSGGAKFMAQMSNIGGGSKETGGEGIQEGFNIIMKNQSAKVALETRKQIIDEKTNLIEEKK